MISIYEADNTTEVATDIDEDMEVVEAGGADHGDGSGDGDLTVSWDHPHVDALRPGNVVRLADRAAFLIRQRTEIEKGDDDAALTVKVVGDPLLDVLKRGRTLGTIQLGRLPQSRTRLWGGACPELPRGDWTTPHEQERATSSTQRPVHWTSDLSEWLWTRAEPSDPEDNHPIEGAWFHTQITFSTTPYMFLQTADDSFRQYLHGVELQDVEQEYPADVWQKPWKAGVNLVAGTYDYVVYAHNDGGRAGILTEIWPIDNNGIHTAPVRLSGLYPDAVFGTWKCLIQPDDEPFPGCTRGLIVRRYLAECHARDELLDVSVDFTDTHDSYGNAWNVTTEVGYSNEGKLYDVVTEMMETDVDAWISLDDDGFVLRMVNHGTRGDSSAFALSGDQIGSLSIVETDDIENDVLVTTDISAKLVRNTASIADVGPRPGGVISAGKVSDPLALERIGNAYLAPRATQGRSIVADTTHLVDWTARPGDTGTVNAEGVQLAGVGFRLVEGELRATPNFETPYQRAVREADRVQRRLIEQAGRIMGSPRITDGGTSIKTGSVEPVKLVSWSWNDAADLDEIEWDQGTDYGWQRYPVEEKMRLCRAVIAADAYEPDGEGGSDKVSTGPTVFEVLLNESSLPAGGWFVTIGENDSEGEAQLWGPALLFPKWKLSCRPVTNGGHINGSLTLYGSAPL